MTRQRRPRPAERVYAGPRGRAAPERAAGRPPASGTRLGGRLDADVARWFPAAPRHGDVVAGGMLRNLSAAHYPSDIVARQAVALPTLLAGRCGSLGTRWSQALALGCVAHSADVRAVAGEAIARTAHEDRLDPAGLAASLAELAGIEGVKVPRLMDTLRPIVAEPLVGQPVLQTLTVPVPALLATGTRDVHQVLVLCSELVVRFGGPVPEGVADVASERGTSRRVADARRLLSLAGTRGR